MNTYDAGTLVRITAAFTNISGVLTDPGAVTCAVEKPDGSTMTPAPTVVKDSVGNYHADVDTTSGPAISGIWAYRFSGSIPLQAVNDGAFYVKVLGF